MTVKTLHRVKFYDTDVMGVVHHANYIRWFETGRVEFLRALGIDLNEMMNDGTACRSRREISCARAFR